jgi:RNA polymerase sigma factor (TIGR02999 family)
MEETITWEDLPRFMIEIRARARALLKRERHVASLQTTELVDSAIARLAPAGKDWSEVTWQNQDHLVATVYQAMLWVLYDHARRRVAVKRDIRRTIRLEELQLHDLLRTVEEAPEQVVALVEAIKQLEQMHPEWVPVVQSRYLGLTVSEIAQDRGVSESTVKREWGRARLWLHKEVLRRLHEAEL